MDNAHKYFAQVQGQLGGIKIEECNLAIYTTTRIHSIPTKFDKPYNLNMGAIIYLFIEMFFFWRPSL